MDERRGSPHGSLPQVEMRLYSLQGVNELLRLDRRGVDDLVDVPAVAVCIGGGDVDEGLQVLHLLGQRQELLSGDHIQLQGVPGRGEEDTIELHENACGACGVCV